MPKIRHYSNHHSGEMPERLNGPVSKTGVGNSTGVQILSPPLFFSNLPSITPLASGITPALGITIIIVTVSA